MDIDGKTGEGSSRGAGTGTGTVVRLPIPPIRTLISAKVEDRDGDVFEGRNSEDISGGLCFDFCSAGHITFCFDHPSSPPRLVPAEVSLIAGKNVEFIDFVSSGVVAVAASSVFCAAALEDSSLNVYSMTGRK